VVKKTDQDEDP